MKFTTPATTNPIDQLKVVGKPVDRIDGPFKTTGTARYAYEQHQTVPDAAYGYVVGATIAKGRIASIDVEAARRSPGVLAIVTYQNAGKLGKGKYNTAKLLAGPEVEHYHQAVAVVVAQTFEQARAAAPLVKVSYVEEKGEYDLERAKKSARLPKTDDKPETKHGNFAAGFASAPVKLDATYTTPDQSHAMMEPHASVAAWDDGRLTLWTSNQMIHWGTQDMAKTLGIPVENVRLISPYIGGGFGGKLFLRAEALLAAPAAQASEVYILDIGLPRIDGYELARRLRQRPASRGALLVALTGYGQAHDFTLSKGAGFDHHLVKPANLEQLERILRAHAAPDTPHAA
ncbi:MAG TPA: hypothetical protein DCX52_13780 [Massilia sp.]|nr:hypothetical protein [Massilia sp.]